MMMLKSLLSLFSIVVLLAPTLILPSRAQACPVRPPSTLLSLYRYSDAIFVGRFDRVDDYETTEKSDEHTVVKIKKNFDISSALKGETQKLLALEDLDYRYKEAEEPADEDVEQDSEQDGEIETEAEINFSDNRASDDLKQGDLVLLFLKKGDDGKTLQLTDSRDGIKKMTPELLDAYSARISELNSIFSAKKPDDVAIVDWIVRCAEDPITRWEGAYQLLQSFEQLEWKEREKAEANEESDGEADSGAEANPSDAAGSEGADVDSPTVEEEVESGSESSNTDAVSEDEPDESIYARLLTDQHKQTLMNIILNRSVMKANEPAKAEVLSDGDDTLVDVVSRWGDNRLARHLLDYLQSAPIEPYAITDLMSTVAGILGDDELENIAESYSRIYYEEDNDPVEKPDEPAPAGEDQSSGNVVIIDGVKTPKASAESAGDGANAEADKTPPKTYKQLREELLATFVQKGVVALAIAESIKAEEERMVQQAGPRP